MNRATSYTVTLADERKQSFDSMKEAFDMVDDCIRSATPVKNVSVVRDDKENPVCIYLSERINQEQLTAIFRLNEGERINLEKYSIQKYRNTYEIIKENQYLQRFKSIHGLFMHIGNVGSLYSYVQFDFFDEIDKYIEPNGIEAYSKEDFHFFERADPQLTRSQEKDQKKSPEMSIE